MKVNVWQILVDHFNTLRDSVSKRISLVDMLVFFGLPLLFSFVSYIEGIRITKDFYNLSVTFFGVFVALLLNFQVAAFGIYNRKWSLNKDEKLSHNQAADLELRRTLLREVNSNISYLIVLSIFSIAIFLLFYAVDIKSRIVSSISIITYVHFMLTLMMVVKRSHILFRNEYNEL